MSKSKKQRFSVPKVKGLEGGAVNVPKFTKYKKNQAGSFQFGPNPEKSAQMFNAANSGDATGAGTSSGGGCSEGFYGEEPTEMELDHALYNFFAARHKYDSVEDYVRDNYKSSSEEYKRDLCSFIHDKVEEEAGECEECESLEEGVRGVLGDIKDTVVGKAQKAVDRGYALGTIKDALKATKNSKHPVMFIVSEACPVNDKDFENAVKLWGGLNAQLFTCAETFTWNPKSVFPQYLISDAEYKKIEDLQKKNAVQPANQLWDTARKDENPAVFLIKLYIITKELHFYKQTEQILKFLNSTTTDQQIQKVQKAVKDKVEFIDNKIDSAGGKDSERDLKHLSNNVIYAIKYRKRLVFKFTGQEYKTLASDFLAKFAPEGDTKFIFDLEGRDIKNFDQELNYKKSKLSNDHSIKASDLYIANNERAAMGLKPLSNPSVKQESFLGETQDNMINLEMLYEPIDFIDNALQWAYDEKLCTKDVDDDGQISIICDGGSDVINSVGSSLNQVCGEHGYTCEKDGPIFIIIASTPTEMTEGRLFKGPTGKEVAKQIKDLADSNKLSYDTADSILKTAAVSDNPATQKKMDDLVKQVKQ